MSPVPLHLGAEGEVAGPCAEFGAWVVDTQRPERFGIVECSTARKVWVVFDPDVWPPEKRWRDQLRQMTDEEIETWAVRARAALGIPTPLTDRTDHEDR